MKSFFPLSVWAVLLFALTFIPVDFAEGQCGGQTYVTGENSAADGECSNASGNFSSAFGFNAHSNGLRSTAVGTEARAGEDNSTAVGHGARAGGINAIAIGQGVRANASQIRIGNVSHRDVIIGAYNLSEFSVGDELTSDELASVRTIGTRPAGESGTVWGYLQTGQIPGTFIMSGGIDTAQIADKAVTQSKLSDDLSGEIDKLKYFDFNEQTGGIAIGANAFAQGRSSMAIGRDSAAVDGFAAGGGARSGAARARAVSRSTAPLIRGRLCARREPRAPQAPLPSARRHCQWDGEERPEGSDLKGLWRDRRRVLCPKIPSLSSTRQTVP